MAGVERDMLIWMVGNKDKKLTLDHAKDLVVDGKPKELLAELFAMHGDHTNSNAIRHWDVPVFPVKGTDLIQKGHQPGPAMGQHLRDLHNRWKQSRFTLGKDSLISDV
jgi:hypothetical protein